MGTIREPARDLPILAEADVCVLGGSCTGVFAAVRAARLGARVVLIEKQGRLGGVASNSLVSIWHSIYDTEGKRQIIAGLTTEMLERLSKRDAVTRNEATPHAAYVLNTEELAIELDELVRESGVQVRLHTLFCAPLTKDGRLAGVAIEDKNGRGAILARAFVDATGDGDLCTRMGLDTYVAETIQPPTTCARFGGWPTLAGVDFKALLREHGREFDLPPGFVWGADVPGSDIRMLAGTRVLHRNCGNADDLTAAEIEGRRQIRAIMDLVRKHVPSSKLVLQALPSLLGIRETRHVACLHRLTNDDVLLGVRFDDAIANGSYRVDVHHQDKPGITFKHLDGTWLRANYDDTPAETGRWRPETAENPTFYQIPLRSIVPKGSENVIIAGRMLDAETEAFGAVRVMVNLNQTGEAAGVTAWLSASRGIPVGNVDAQDVRSALADGGALVI